MKAVPPGVLLISMGMAVLTAQTNAIQAQASETIDKTIIREVDLTRDGKPEKIVLHVVGKDIRSPFSWTLEVFSKTKRIFYKAEVESLESDELFSHPEYLSNCKDYESCKKEWYFSGILRTFLRLRIPRDSGRVFRRKAATIPSEAGHGSDGKAAAFEPVVGKVAGMARKIAG